MEARAEEKVPGAGPSEKEEHLRDVRHKHRKKGATFRRAARPSPPDYSASEDEEDSDDQPEPCSLDSPPDSAVRTLALSPAEQLLQKGGRTAFLAAWQDATASGLLSS